MSAAPTVRCLVITPERTVVDDQVDRVIAPLYDGEFGILPRRAPVVARLGYGELRLCSGALVVRYYVDGGFLHVRNDVVSILTPQALRPEELNEAAIRSDLEKAIQMIPRTPEEERRRQEQMARARGKLLVIRHSQAG